MSKDRQKRYIMQISPGGSDFGSFEEFEMREGQEFVKQLLDETTREILDCRIVVSSTPKEGYDELILEGIGLQRSEKKWYVHILEKLEDAEEGITVFQSAKPSERRGYMLRSMANEQKTERKKEIMTSELEERKKRKQKLTEEILKRK